MSAIDDAERAKVFGLYGVRKSLIPLIMQGESKTSTTELYVATMIDMLVPLQGNVVGTILTQTVMEVLDHVPERCVSVRA